MSDNSTLINQKFGYVSPASLNEIDFMNIRKRPFHHPRTRSDSNSKKWKFMEEMVSRRKYECFRTQPVIDIPGSLDYGRGRRIKSLEEDDYIMKKHYTSNLTSLPRLDSNSSLSIDTNCPLRRNTEQFNSTPINSLPSLCQDVLKKFLKFSEGVERKRAKKRKLKKIKKLNKAMKKRKKRRRSKSPGGSRRRNRTKVKIAPFMTPKKGRIRRVI